MIPFYPTISQLYANKPIYHHKIPLFPLHPHKLVGFSTGLKKTPEAESHRVSSRAQLGSLGAKFIDTVDGRNPAPVDRWFIP